MVWPVSDLAVKSSGEVAVPSAVAMSNVTPPAPAALVRLTVNVNVVVPELPSLCDTSLIDSAGVPPEQPWTGDAPLRGAGATTAKSIALLSVSAQPLPRRSAAVVFEVAGAALEPSKKSALPYPIRSTMVASAAASHGVEPPLQPSGVVVLTSATLPAVADMAIGVASVTSGIGSDAPFPAPAPSWTRKYWPGASVPDNSVNWFAFAPKPPVPVALAYWTDQPASETGFDVGLKSST